MVEFRAAEDAGNAAPTSAVSITCDNFAPSVLPHAIRRRLGRPAKPTGSVNRDATDDADGSGVERSTTTAA
jgi:hypothetical protein